MKKSMWIKIGILGVAVIGLIICFIVSIVQNTQTDNPALTNCAYYSWIETGKVTIGGRIFVLSEVLSERAYGGDSYSIEEDSVILTYDTDPDTKVLLTTYEDPKVLDLALEDTYFSVTYLENQNTSLEKQASDFYNDMLEEDGYTFVKTEETTWEDIKRYYYLSSNPKGSVKDCVFNSYDWDIDVWHFELADETKNAVLEVLFFERADGFYRIDMYYPENDDDAKEEIYADFGYISFKTDTEKVQIAQENIVVTESIQADGSMIVTIVNEGDYIVESLHCDLTTYCMQDDKEIQFGIYTIVKTDVAPGSIVTLTYESDLLTDTTRHTVNATVFPYARYMDDDGTIHSSN